MNEYTKLNKSKVLLYQMQVPLNFLLPIFFPLVSGDDGDGGGWSSGGSELSWTSTMKRSNGWQFECLFLCLVDNCTVQIGIIVHLGYKRLMATMAYCTRAYSWNSSNYLLDWGHGLEFLPQAHRLQWDSHLVSLHYRMMSRFHTHLKMMHYYYQNLSLTV